MSVEVSAETVVDADVELTIVEVEAWVVLFVVLVVVNRGV